MPRLFGTLLICAVIFTLSSGYASAQETPDLKPYVQKKVNFQGVLQYWDIRKWCITGKKTSIVYITRYEADDTNSLVGYKLSAKGVAGPPIPILSNIDGFIYGATAVWFDSAGGPVKSPAGAAGLLFALYLSYTTEKIAVSVVDIDAEGKPVGSFRTLMEKTAPENENFQLAYIQGSAGADSIAVIISLINWKSTSTFSGFVSSKAYYLQTDFNGLLLGGLSEVPLPNGGNMNLCIVGSPFRTGSGLMMPAFNSRLAAYTNPEWGIQSTKGLGSELYVITSSGGAGAPAVKFKRRLLFKDNQEYDLWTFRNASFLDLEENAQPGAKKTKKTVTLFFGHRNYIPLDQRVLDGYTSDYYLVPIDLRGKKAGGSIKVDIPHWQHGMPYDPNKFMYDYFNGVSDPVRGPDGTFYLAQGRTTLMAKYVSAPGYYIFDCEHELSLYELDPATGEVELIAQKASGTPVGDYSAPVLRWFNNSPAILNAIFVQEPVRGDQCYFTSVSVK